MSEYVPTGDVIAIVGLAASAEPGAFDAEFFGFDRAAAEATDGRLLMLLETCWQAMEYAGIDPATPHESDTSVHIGAAVGDFGSAATVLGLRGPVLSIDTGASAMLAALALATRSLTAGDCSLALAGGVGGLAEGAAVFVLERLSDARERGHRVLALVRGAVIDQGDSTDALLHAAGITAADLDVQQEFRGDSPMTGISAVLDLIRELGEGPMPRRGTVSVFGTGGTGAHVLLERAPESAPTMLSDRGHRVPLVIWPLSGKSPEALVAQATHLADHVRAHPEITAREVGHALTTTRSTFDHRAVVLGRNRVELLAGLAAVAAGNPAGPPRGRAVPRRVAFVFPGHGPQFTGMAAQLLSESPVFAASIAECDAALSEFVDWSLIDVLNEAPGAPSVERPDVVQPALFAAMVSLAALWKSFGIVPAAVIGHSQGEIAAAYVAGALSLSDAARIVVSRSKLLVELKGTGGMAAVNASAARVRELMSGIADLHIAAVNSPSATTVAGGVAAVERMLAACERAGVRARRLAAEAAGHTEHVDVLRERFSAAVAPVTAHATDVTFVSTVVGGVLAGEELGPDYWFRNMREPVNFDDGCRSVHAAGCDALIELSVHPVLAAAMHESLGDAADSCLILSSLRRDDAGIRRVLTAIGEGHVGGVSPAWPTIYPVGSERPIELPTYAFQRRRYRHTVVSDAAPDMGNEAAVDGSRPALFGVEWLPLQAWRGRYSDSRGGWAIIGAGSLGVRGAVGTHRDLESLCAAVHHDDVVPPVVVLSRLVSGDTGSDAQPPQALRAELAGMLKTIQTWLAEPRFAESKLVILTRGVHSAEADAGVWALVDASAWALVRTAQSEHPDRIVQIDLDADDISLDEIATALRLEEPELALRRGEFLGRRLRSGADVALPPEAAAAPPAFDPNRTVLITGGTGAIGAIMARHLVRGYGAKHLLITSRRGAGAAGIAELTAELAAMGAQTTVAACDVSDRDALAAVLARVPDAHPVGAVVHLAAALADATFTALTADQLDTALAAKAVGAWHLHELTAHLDLSMFVLFSSAAGVFGWPGQANYSAANVFLDGLAGYRQRRGLPATALAWGWWGDTYSLDELDDAGRARFGRLGLTPITSAEAVEFFDAALRTGVPYALPVGLDISKVADGSTGEPAPLFRALPHAGGRAAAKADDPAALTARMAALGPAERLSAMTELLKAPVSMVLGHATPDVVQSDRQFAEMGLDSLASIELGARLRAMTGVRVGNAVIYKHPTVRLLAGHVLEQIIPRPADLAAPIVVEVEQLLDRLSAIYDREPLPTDLIARLTEATDRLRDTAVVTAESVGSVG